MKLHALRKSNEKLTLCGISAERRGIRIFYTRDPMKITCGQCFHSLRVATKKLSDAKRELRLSPPEDRK